MAFIQIWYELFFIIYISIIYFKIPTFGPALGTNAPKKNMPMMGPRVVPTTVNIIWKSF